MLVANKKKKKNIKRRGEEFKLIKIFFTKLGKFQSDIERN